MISGTLRYHAYYCFCEHDLWIAFTKIGPITISKGTKTSAAPKLVSNYKISHNFPKSFQKPDTVTNFYECFACEIYVRDAPIQTLLPQKFNFCRL